MAIGNSTGGAPIFETLIRLGGSAQGPTPHPPPGTPPVPPPDPDRPPPIIEPPDPVPVPPVEPPPPPVRDPPAEGPVRTAHRHGFAPAPHGAYN
jgi:hypothetical protein